MPSRSSRCSCADPRAPSGTLHSTARPRPSTRAALTWIGLVGGCERQDRAYRRDHLDLRMEAAAAPLEHAAYLHVLRRVRIGGVHAAQQQASGGHVLEVDDRVGDARCRRRGRGSGSARRPSTGRCGPAGPSLRPAGARARAAGAATARRLRSIRTRPARTGRSGGRTAAAPSAGAPSDRSDSWRSGCRRRWWRRRAPRPRSRPAGHAWRERPARGARGRRRSNRRASTPRPSSRGLPAGASGVVFRVAARPQA